MERNTDMTYHILELYRNAHNEVLSKLFKQITGRDPNTNDGKDFTLGFYPPPSTSYSVAYKGTDIGRIETVFEGATIKVTFHPRTHETHTTPPI